MALAAEEKGELAAAQDHWQIILLGEPGDLQASQQIVLLTTKIEKKTTTTYNKGLLALRSGKARQAKKFFIKTLTLQPSHSGAFIQLQKIQSAQMHKFQHAKPKPPEPVVTVHKDEENAAHAAMSSPRIDKRLRANVRRIKAYLAANQLDQADLQYQYATQIESNDLVAKEQLSHLSGLLADHYYQQARRLIRSDIDKTIDYLQISIRYAPNKEAQKLLKKSRLIHTNLLRIQGDKTGANQH